MLRMALAYRYVDCSLLGEVFRVSRDLLVCPVPDVRICSLNMASFKAVGLCVSYSFVIIDAFTYAEHRYPDGPRRPTETERFCQKNDPRQRIEREISV